MPCVPHEERNMSRKLPSSQIRAANEIRHGRFLASHDPERIWGWSTPAGQLRARRRAQLITKAAHLGPGLKVLEIGCGTGFFTELFVQSGCHILAVDISADLLTLAQKRNIPSSSVTFMQMPFEHIPDLESFDAVIGSSILHHLDIHQACAKILALLKPGGKIAFAEPNLFNPQVYLERRFSHWPVFSYTSPDETAFKRGRLANVLQKTGFINIEIKPFDWLHPSTPSKLIPLISSIGRILERVPFLRELSGSLIISGNKPEML